MEELIKDVVCLAVPEDIDPERDQIIEYLTTVAERSVWFQFDFAGLARPEAIHFNSIDWLITKDPADVEKFQPAHDCEACRAGNERSLTFLNANPDRWIAMGNIEYREVWPD